MSRGEAHRARGSRQFWQGRGASLALVFLATSTACAGPAASGPSPARAPAVTDAVSLSAALRARDIRTTPADAVEQPFFSVTGAALDVEDGQIQVFDYPDEAAAGMQIASIAPDGSAVGMTKIHWLAPPQFYRAGKLIVLYLGSDPRLREALKALFGPPFAEGAP